MSFEHLVGSLLAVAFGELLSEGVDLGFESVDLVVHVFDSLMFGVAGGSFGAWKGRAGVTVPGDFEVEVGLAVEPGSGHAGGLGDGGHGEREPSFVEAPNGGHGSLAGVS